MQRVLIVEDHADLRHIFTEAFELEGFRVRSVASGLKALADLQLTTPDILILDVGLPDMSGLEVLQRVRQSHPAMTIIIVTANHLAEQCAEAALADMFLIKPVDIHTLVKIAERLKTMGLPQQSVSSQTA